MKRIILILGLLTSFAYAQSKAGFYVVGGKLITVQDTSSRNYLKAVENAGIVPSVIQNFASNYLVTTEKAIGSYSLMVAQYPFIGGTAATHKFNLNDPRDLDAAFRLVFNGTITHSALGMQGDGSTGYADTKFLANTLSLTNSGLSVYINAIGNGVEISAASTGTNRFSTHSQSTGADLNIRSGIGNYQSDAITPFTNYLGFLSGNKSASNRQTLIYKGGIIVSTFNDVTGSMPNCNVFLMANNNTLNVPSGITLPSNKRVAYDAIHQALTDAQAIQQSQIVTFFNSIQGRQ